MTFECFKAIFAGFWIYLFCVVRRGILQVGVDYGGQNMVKFVQDEKYSTKSLIFSDFLLTFAMSLMILLVLICSTKVSEISDMAKS